MPHTLVTPEMRAKATTQRRQATKGEARLWHEPRELKSDGLKLRRQSPLGPSIAEFVCFNPKIDVEVDGDQHETEQGKRHDSNRDAYLRASGFAVFRFDASDAVDNAWRIALDDKDRAEALMRSRTAEVTPPGSLREPPSPRGGVNRHPAASPQGRR